MLILAVSDFHGKMDWLLEALDRCSPDLLLSPGDWGDPGQLSERDYRAVLERVPMLTIYGNHDDRTLLERLRNQDGSPALLKQGEARSIHGLVVAGISGIWAKTRLGSKIGARWEAAHRQNPALTLEEWAKDHPLPPYITDEETASLAEILAIQEVDILITHGCPGGLGDLTPQGTHGGQRCFRAAFEKICPPIHLCGHLHRFQRDDLPDGRVVLNCGSGADRDGWLIRYDFNDPSDQGSKWSIEPIRDVKRET